MLIDQLKVSELELARRLYARLAPGDVGLADRAYGSYVDLASVQARGADGVFRCHQRRSCDFRRGQRLGKDDHLVTWDKPKQCPKHMSQAAFAQLPDSLTVREVRFQVVQPGYRTKTIIVVTTLSGCVEVLTPLLDQLNALNFRLSPATRAAVLKLANE